MHRKQLYLHEVDVKLDLMLLGVRRDGERLLATLRNDLTDESIEIETDQVVVERGTFPVDEVYQELKENAANRGVTDIDALINARPQPAPEADGYLLYRIGDAISSRSLHAALLDAYRIAVTL